MTSTLVGFIVIGFWLMAFLLAWLSYKSDSKRFSVIWAVLSGICALTFMGFFPFVFWIALIIMVSIRWRRQS